MIIKLAGNKNFPSCYVTFLQIYKSSINPWLGAINKNMLSLATIFSGYWGRKESLCELGNYYLRKVSVAGLNLCFKVKNVQWSTSDENLSLFINKNKMHQPQYTICILHNLWNLRKEAKNVSVAIQWKILYMAFRKQ